MALWKMTLEVTLIIMPRSWSRTNGRRLATGEPVASYPSLHLGLGMFEELAGWRHLNWARFGEGPERKAHKQEFVYFS